jgi:hypothetical protein
MRSPPDGIWRKRSRSTTGTTDWTEQQSALQRNISRPLKQSDPVLTARYFIKKHDVASVPLFSWQNNEQNLPSKADQSFEVQEID